MKKIYYLYSLILISLIFSFCAYSEANTTTGEPPERLMEKAWAALKDKDYDAVYRYADECISSNKKAALEDQSELTGFPPAHMTPSYAALNNVGTCLFIKGKALREQGKKEEARKTFETIIKDFSHSQCFDLKGFYWKVADGAKDEIVSIEKGVDFGNMTSETLVLRAWESLSSGKYKKVDIYVDKALSLYEEKAQSMQAKLKDFANNERAFDYWALNDVATALFIQAKSLQIRGKKEEAKKLYRRVIDDFSYAQAWDTQGWFWKVSEAAEDQILVMESGIDFGDYTSETLTTKAWTSYGAGEYDKAILFAKKCVLLYRKYADDMQTSLDGYAAKEKAFDYWALNDVGTCYFIMGESYMAKNDPKEAYKAYQMIADKYFYAQCWDPKGWFWKPATTARGKINKINSESGNQLY